MNTSHIKDMILNRANDFDNDVLEAAAEIIKEVNLVNGVIEIEAENEINNAKELSIVLVRHHDDNPGHFSMFGTNDTQAIWTSQIKKVDGPYVYTHNSVYKIK